MKIMVIQGPNLNMLGHREPNLYGNMTLEEIHAQMKNAAEQNNVEIEFFQSNYEGEIVDKIQECLGTADGIIINPAAYAHSSIAIRDAVLAVGIPTIEIHITNIARRDEFRQKSLIAPVTVGQISGFGPVGYHLALMGMFQIFEQIKIIKARSQEQKAADE